MQESKVVSYESEISERGSVPLSSALDMVDHQYRCFTYVSDWLENIHTIYSKITALYSSAVMVRYKPKYRIETGSEG